MEPSYSSEAVKVTASSPCEQQKGREVTAPSLSCPNRHLSWGSQGSIGVSASHQAKFAKRESAEGLSGLLGSCTPLMLAGSGCVPQQVDSVHPQPQGEDEHLIGMLATLGGAERGDIKRSLV